MTVAYERKQLAEGIFSTTVVDKKFKSNQIRVRFLTPLSPETAAEQALAVGMLSMCCKKYPTLAALSARRAELYGTGIGSDITRSGDLQVLSLSVSAIDSRYALEGEDVNALALELLLGCLFEPNAENGAFEESMFRIRKKDLLDTILAEINNKRGYAISQARKLMFEGESAAYAAYGELKEAEMVTAESAYRAYCRLLEEAQIELYFIGGSAQPEAEAKLLDAFSKIRRAPRSVEFLTPSPCKAEVRCAEEQLDVEQSKLVLALKYDYTNPLMMRLMNTVLGGGSTVSKLFVNVREKMSLCYYCASSLAPTKRTLLIDSGIAIEKREIAQQAILDQIRAICDGDFSEEDIDNAARTISDDIGAVGDTPSSWVGWYFDRLTMNEFITPQEMLDRLSAALAPENRAETRAEIIKAAKSLKLDTVYLMQQREEA